MQCPKCKHERQRVLDTRPVGDETYRKRICVKCYHIFVTYEKFYEDSTYKPRRNKRSSNAKERLDIKNK